MPRGRKKKVDTEEAPKQKKSKAPGIDGLLTQSEGRLVLAKETDCSYLLRRPSGIFSLDYATAGGLPAATLSEIAGPEGIGKNYIANRYIAECQRIYGNDARIFVAVTEYKYDKSFARFCGVQVAFSDPEIAELEQTMGGTFTKEEKAAFKHEVGQIALIQNLPAEHILQQVIECMESNVFHIGVIDSLGATSPIPEVMKDMDETPKMGASASLQTFFMHKFYYRKGSKTMLLVLNQVRANMSPYGSRYRTPEAYSIRHGLIAKIFLSPGGEIYDKNKQAIGKNIRWEIQKGKAGFHEGAKGEWVYHYDRGIDMVDDFVSIAALHAEQTGAYYTFMDQRFHGKDEFAQFFRSNPDKIEEAKNYIIKKANMVYKWVE